MVPKPPPDEKNTKKPPSVTSEELERMYLRELKKHTADTLSTDEDFSGAGEWPISD